MEIVRSLDALRDAVAALRRQRGAVSLVPTMGALHAGHVALVAASRPLGAVAASIFVNPLQFGQGEDFSRYPRDEAADLARLAAAGCDLAWLPDVDGMYGPDDATLIEVAGPARLWEGAHRPTHFRGVATVVNRLFGQVQPDFAFFGEKDWQQCQVIRRMVADLRMVVDIRLVPTVREPDGVAMSSRNRFLTPAQRELAPRLFSEISRAAGALAGGAPVDETLDRHRAALDAAGFAVDYLALVAAESLVPLAALERPARLITAAKLGTVRLLDNVPVPWTAMAESEPPRV